MATPASGQISFSDMAWIISRNYNATVSLGDGEVRALLGQSGQISMSDAYSKPTQGRADYGPGAYTFYVPAYQSLYAQVAAGGGGGQSGSTGHIVGCGWWWAGRCCDSYCSGIEGGAGGGSSVLGIAAYGGTNWNAGGNNQNGGTGGGGGGGAAGAGSGDCNNADGSAGQPGGFCEKYWTKGVDGPGYSAAYTVTVGAGGYAGPSCGGNPTANPGGAGGNGWCAILWS